MDPVKMLLYTKSAGWNKELFFLILNISQFLSGDSGGNHIFFLCFISDNCSDSVSNFGARLNLT